MQAYTSFANVYDIFMDNVPYDEWSEYVAGLLSEYGVTSGLVLELGCGTGSITRRLAKRGYDMIGIDLSEDMLLMAREKGAQEGLSYDQILYLNQDMREFELYGTVGAVISICDSINYITSEEDLTQVFRLVNNYLDPQGVFVFDLNTLYKYKEVLGDTTIAENREDCSFIWENFYHEENTINQYDITIYKKSDVELLEEGEEEQDAGVSLYERFEETHYQKAYELDTIKRLLLEAGMEYVTAYDAMTRTAPQEKSERIYVVAREMKQENKLYLSRI